MSVNLKIAGIPGSPVDIYVPIASQAGYADVFVPLAAELGLQWIPLFEGGEPVPLEDVPDVVREFEQVREALSRDASLGGFVNRVDRVIAALREHIGREDVRIWIG